MYVLYDLFRDIVVCQCMFCTICSVICCCLPVYVLYDLFRDILLFVSVCFVRFVLRDNLFAKVCFVRFVQ